MESTGGGPVLFLFLDGVGIGPEEPDRNPFFASRLPTLRSVLGGRLPSLERPRISGPRGVAFPLDATLGVHGIPQSGTGQTALLTGRNAPELYGRHFGPWTPVRLRDLLAEENLMSRAVASGHSVAFANAYPRGWPGSRQSRRLAAPPLAAKAAGLLTRHAEELATGEAVASEIVNRGWRLHLGFDSLPEITPEEAGSNLARIAARNRLTFFAHYETDHAGHRGGMEGAVEALQRVDAFLHGILDQATDDLLILVTSDHGNVEDVTAQHTRNPALGLVHGPGSREVASRLARITDVPAVILELLGGGSDVG
ncbi:MAG: alkaline phosphatase family protein [Longimicrobiales bacterium]|nr:alkaline phosphatase family protein [Longimicrobiales bacterium]